MRSGYPIPTVSGHIPLRALFLMSKSLHPSFPLPPPPPPTPTCIHTQVNHVNIWEGEGGQGNPRIHPLSVWVCGFEGVLLVALRLRLGREYPFSSHVLFFRFLTNFIK